uniref:Gag-pol polyprotein n=1 Tax=Solanum tuberosum TaxID=4113 RepID=M1D8D1_SOLTU
MTERVERKRQKRDRPAGSHRDFQGGPRPRYSSRPPRPPPQQFQGSRFDLQGQSGPSKGSRASGSKQQRGSGQARIAPLRCATCGQSTGSVVGSSSSTQSTGSGPQTSAGRGRGGGREGASSSGSGQNRTYSLAGWQVSESSPDVVTGALIVCFHYVYALIDLGSTLSYVAPFIAGKLCIVAKSLDRPFTVSTPVGESIIARKVYRGCTVEIIDRHTSMTW